MVSNPGGVDGEDVAHSVSRHDIKWEVLNHAAVEFSSMRKDMGDEMYEHQKRSLQEFICNYFNSGSDCQKKQGSSVSPLGNMPCTGKALKVRWALPGGGKSGGLRLAVVALCKEKRVKIAGAWRRKEDPATEDLESAFSDA